MYNYPLGTSLSNGFLPQILFLFHFCLISVMSGQSNGYLGIISTFFRVNVSCSRTQHDTPRDDRTPTLSLTNKPIRNFGSFINIHDHAHEINFI